MFDIDQARWSTFTLTKEKDMFIPPDRRNHVAGLFNNHMIVYGGLNDQKILNDLSSLDLVKKKWTPIFCCGNKDHGFGLKKLPGLYRARAVMVLHNQRRD